MNGEMLKTAAVEVVSRINNADMMQGAYARMGVDAAGLRVALEPWSKYDDEAKSHVLGGMLIGLIAANTERDLLDEQRNAITINMLQKAVGLIGTLNDEIERLLKLQANGTPLEGAELKDAQDRQALSSLLMGLVRRHVDHLVTELRGK